MSPMDNTFFNCEKNIPFPLFLLLVFLRLTIERTEHGSLFVNNARVLSDLLLSKKIE